MFWVLHLRRLDSLEPGNVTVSLVYLDPAGLPADTGALGPTLFRWVLLVSLQTLGCRVRLFSVWRLLFSPFLCYYRERSPHCCICKFQHFLKILQII